MKIIKLIHPHNRDDIKKLMPKGSVSKINLFGEDFMGEPPHAMPIPVKGSFTLSDEIV